MQLYRYSPIKNPKELLKAIQHLHHACHLLCQKHSIKNAKNAGNIGIFCHYEEEYQQLIQMRKTMTKSSNNPKQKYFPLHQPIIIKGRESSPQGIYTHLYIRKPDPYRSQVGDIDFFLENDEYKKAKKQVQNHQIYGIRTFASPTLDMIELFDPDIDALAYISTKNMTEKVKTTPSLA